MLNKEDYPQGLLFQNDNYEMSGSGSEHKMTEEGQGIMPQ